MQQKFLYQNRSVERCRDWSSMGEFQVSTERLYVPNYDKTNAKKVECHQAACLERYSTFYEHQWLECRFSGVIMLDIVLKTATLTLKDIVIGNCVVIEILLFRTYSQKCSFQLPSLR
jgi:hypothetical protein